MIRIKKRWAKTLSDMFKSLMDQKSNLTYDTWLPEFNSRDDKEEDEDASPKTYIIPKMKLKEAKRRCLKLVILVEEALLIFPNSFNIKLDANLLKALYKNQLHIPDGRSISKLAKFKSSFN